jgi:hypothetical protein
MLITVEHRGYPIVQAPVETIYEQGNRCLHFNPPLDSMQISMLLIRFRAVAALTAIVDNVAWVRLVPDDRGPHIDSGSESVASEAAGVGHARYTSLVLASVVRRYARPHPVMVDIGPVSNRCLREVLRAVQPREYHVADLKEHGLELLRQRLDGNAPMAPHRQEVRALQLPVKADAVFSLGLMEHFNPAGTAEAVCACPTVLAAGGIAVISFPNPTSLDHFTRRVTGLFGLRRFPDERPLQREEVTHCLAGRGRILLERTL